MNHYDVWHEVAMRIQTPGEACAFISSLMQHCANKTFNGFISADFTNSKKEIRAAVSGFCEECTKAFSVKAIYLEMNGFDINPDRWYFDFFGYQALPENATSMALWDWLCKWQSSDYPSVTLTGLESIQSLFEQYNKLTSRLNLDELDKDLAYNHELVILLVMAKFCKLVHECFGNGFLGIDVFATAHDFDIIYHKGA